MILTLLGDLFPFYEATIGSDHRHSDDNVSLKHYSFLLSLSSPQSIVTRGFYHIPLIFPRNSK